MNILLTYDVDTTSVDGQKRLRHVAKVCMNYGQRVQNSVFECHVSEAQLCMLKKCIMEIIDTSLDSIRIYRLSRNENKCVQVLGVETSYNVNDTLII